MKILANEIRPQSLKEVLGQEHIIGQNKIINNLVKNKVLFSMILYGPPGTGKTSIATAIVNELHKPYRMLNAVTSKKEDFDIVIEEAKMNGEMLVIIDEIHRMNKDKQDLLLPYMENGILVIIGLTTSNPYHSINPAIRSRCQIFELKPLTEKDILKGLKQAIKHLNNIKINNKCLDIIVKSANGDFRSALNLLEIAYYSASKHEISENILKDINPNKSYYIDKNEDNYYDTISAFQKSIRGSDVNASLYYLGILLQSGDLDIIFRRLTVIAYEDIGLANPGMGPKVYAAVESAKMLGLPEAMIPLSVVVTELALSPKSCSANEAIHIVMNEINKGNTGKVPPHLRTSSPNYLYPHNYPKYYVKQQYLPDNLINKKYYRPRNNTYEKNLNKINEEMRK